MPRKYESLRARLDAMSRPAWLVPGLACPCRIWQGALNSSGYPVLTMRGRHYRTYIVNGKPKRQKRVKRVLAHRASLADYLGVKIWQLNKAAHECDNKPCIEPTHLRSKSQKSNMADMVKRRRAAWQRKPNGAENDARLAA